MSEAFGDFTWGTNLIAGQIGIGAIAVYSQGRDSGGVIPFPLVNLAGNR
jgi:hypothetical protein